MPDGNRNYEWESKYLISNYLVSFKSYTKRQLQFKILKATHFDGNFPN